MTTIEKIEADKDLIKTLRKIDMDIDSFIHNAERYLKAIREGRMCCNIVSVSKSGMSRVLKFNECSGNDKAGFRYLNFFQLFRAMGYSQSRNKDGFTVSGCGMDMVFHTNYSICRSLFHLGFITQEECKSLEQNTPVVL